MLIPIGTDRVRKRPTVVTYWLIGICCVVFLVQFLIGRSNQQLEQTYIDPLILNPSTLKWWQFITHQFLHGDLMHLLGNMLFLYVFGPCVEDRFRRLGFLAFYLLGGVFAATAHIFFDVGHTADGLLLPASRVLGASGSIAAVAGAFLVLFPLTGVRVVLLFFVIGMYVIPAWWFVVFSIVKDLVLESFHDEGIAHIAHLGGYTAGAIFAMLLLWGKIIPREPYDLFSIGRQAKRRREFRELASKGTTPWLGDPGKPAKSGDLTADDTRIAERRAEVSHLLASCKKAQAVERFAALLTDFPDTIMSRSTHLELANHTFAAGNHRIAAVAYERFIAKNPSDRETPGIKLMLAVIHARYLNDTSRARTLLAEIDDTKLADDQRELANGLRDELAGTTSS